MVYLVFIVFGVVGVVGVVVVVWGIGIECYFFMVCEVFVEVLLVGFVLLCILYVLDVYMVLWQYCKQDWLVLFVEFKFDFIVNMGDNLGYCDGFDGICWVFVLFVGIFGVFVYGLNDVIVFFFCNLLCYFFGLLKKKQDLLFFDIEVMDVFFMDELGWIDLNNIVVWFVVGGCEIVFFGVDDVYCDWDCFEDFFDVIDVLGLCDDVMLMFGVIYVFYQCVFNGFIDLGVDVIFGGYMYGGQVCFFGYGVFVVNCDILFFQVKGFSIWLYDGWIVLLNVSVGCGYFIYVLVCFVCWLEVMLFMFMVWS